MSERAPIPMVPTPASIEAMMAHLEASRPGGHAKAELNDGTAPASLAKLVALHAQMHGGAAHPMAHNHPVPVIDQKDMQGDGMDDTTETNSVGPRDDLVRAYAPGTEYEVRDGSGDVAGTLVGHFAVFNEWTEIASAREGHFMERIAPGAFAHSIQNNGAGIRVLFNHGRDPSIGDKVLGPIASLAEDERGVAYEVPLLDTSYNRDLLPGLRAGLYGSSFRFNILAEDKVRSPKRSDHNPDGIPERTVREARVPEFGPVTFPAYAGADASARSLTDEYVFSRFTDDAKRLSQLIDYVRGITHSEPEAAAQSARASEGPDSEKATAPSLRGQHLPRTRRKRNDYMQRKAETWRL